MLFFPQKRECVVPIWFHYSFECPRCGETIQSHGELISASSREQISAEVSKRHPECLHCHKPFPEGKILLSITETYSMNL